MVVSATGAVRCRPIATVCVGWCGEWPMRASPSLAELARRDLVPEIWLSDPGVRAERERARLRLHLVKHRRSLKNRVHAILFQHGVPNGHSDLFGAGGRPLLERAHPPAPWARTLRAPPAL